MWPCFAAVCFNAARRGVPVKLPRFGRTWVAAPWSPARLDRCHASACAHGCVGDATDSDVSRRRASQPARQAQRSVGCCCRNNILTELGVLLVLFNHAGRRVRRMCHPGVLPSAAAVGRLTVDVACRRAAAMAATVQKKRRKRRSSVMSSNSYVDENGVRQPGEPRPIKRTRVCS